MLAAVVSVAAAFYSGYQGADHANQTFQVSEQVIHQHHLIGKLLLFAIVPCLIFRLAAEKARYNQAAFWWLYRACLSLCLSLAIYTGYLGGRLVFSHGAGVDATLPASAATVAGEAEHR